MTQALQNTNIDQPHLIKVIIQNWQTEMEGAATYRMLAEREDDTKNAEILRGLSHAEENHAKLWAQRLKELGAPEPSYTGRSTGQVDTLINRIGGPSACLRRAEIDERKHVLQYGRQLKELGDEASVAILRKVMDDERAHSKVLKALILPAEDRRRLIRSGVKDPQAALEELRKRSGRKSPASWIGDAIYGINDELGAIFGIVSGVSGATLGNSHFVLLAGLSGMIASALSMGSGAYLASKSEREIYEAELFRKRTEIEENPEQGREEMSLIYQVKGVPAENADRMAEQLSKNPETFLRTLATEELNISEEGLSNPIVSAVTGSLSTAVGAFIPIIPFFFLHGYPAVIAAAIISLAAHFAVGAAKTLITVRSWWSSGFEMTIVGAIEGVVTYFVGVGLGRLGA